MAALLRLVTAVGEMTDNVPCTTTELSFADAEDSFTLPSTAGKLAGCRGILVSALLPPGVDELTLAAGVFEGSDGTTTNPIELAALKRVVLVFSTADGAPLPAGMGGPLRAWAPGGCAVQESKCGASPAAIDVEAVRELRVRSTDSAAAICLEGGKALILQRGPTAPWMPNRWNLPGGGIDGGESAEQAAVRETQEEAGLTLQAPRLLGELEYVDGRLLAVFVADQFTGDLKINWESSAYEWVDESQLAGFDFVPPIEQALRMAFASLAQ